MGLYPKMVARPNLMLRLWMSVNSADDRGRGKPVKFTRALPSVRGPVALSCRISFFSFSVVPIFVVFKISTFQTKPKTTLQLRISFFDLAHRFLANPPFLGRGAKIFSTRARTRSWLPWEKAYNHTHMRLHSVLRNDVMYCNIRKIRRKSAEHSSASCTAECTS